MFLGKVERRGNTSRSGKRLKILVVVLKQHQVKYNVTNEMSGFFDIES